MRPMTSPKSAKRTPKRRYDPTGPSAARIEGMLPRQHRFATGVLLHGNATKAAIDAGYSKNGADTVARANLKRPAIVSFLSKKRAESAEKLRIALEAMELTIAKVGKETARVAFFDARKLFDASGKPLPITELDDDTAAAIVGLEVLEEFEGSGKERKLVGYVKKYKIADKNTALERAAKILGMFCKDNEQKTDPLTELLKSLGRSTVPIVADDPDYA
jgi:phage terminase small subunit